MTHTHTPKRKRDLGGGLLLLRGYNIQIGGKEKITKLETPKGTARCIFD